MGNKIKKESLENLTDLGGLTDIVSGPMNVDCLTNELSAVFRHRTPREVIITMEKLDRPNLYHTSIYIDRESFNNYEDSRQQYLPGLEEKRYIQGELL